MFRATVADANNINDAYHHFTGKNVGSTTCCVEQGNAVMLWHAHPQASDLTFVTTCLK